MESEKVPAWQTAVFVLLLALAVVPIIVTPWEKPPWVAQATATAQAGLTATANAVATATGQAPLTATAHAQSTATAQAPLTATAHQQATATAQAGATQAAGTQAAATAQVFFDALPPSDEVLPLAWPPPPISDDQLEAARACDIEGLLESRYPGAMQINDLQAAYIPETGCDWAVLAVAYGERLGEGPLPEPIRQAFAQTLSDNPAYALSTPVFMAYLGRLSVSEPPPVAQQAITEVAIEYSYSSIGYVGDYTARITQANSYPVVYGYSTEDRTLGQDDVGRIGHSIYKELDVELVQALGPALSDLMPVDSLFEMQVCSDNYPDWTITLTFEDGTKLDVVTNGSNFMYVGGPWQVTIEEQTYVQVSLGFLRALLDIVEAADLPLGETAAMNCGPNPQLLDLAFPER